MSDSNHTTQPRKDSTRSLWEALNVSPKPRWTVEQAAERRAFHSAIRAKLQAESTGAFAQLMEARRNPDYAAQLRTISKLELMEAGR